MIHKQLFFIACITFSFYTYSTPVNIPANNNFLKKHFVQPAQKHPKKTIAGALILGNGLKLIHEGIKTRDRLGKNDNYNLIGIGTEVVGGILMSIGTGLLLPAIWDMIFPDNPQSEKTNSPELPKKE